MDIFDIVYDLHHIRGWGFYEIKKEIYWGFDIKLTNNDIISIAYGE